MQEYVGGINKKEIMATADEIREKYDKPIEIAPGIWWVGFYDEKSNFHCNPYLMIDGGNAIMFDPGSVPHFPIVARKVFGIIEPHVINKIILSHQDPDLCAAVPLFEEIALNPNMKIITTERSGFLISHYGVKSPMEYIEKINFELPIGNERSLKFIPTPYCHTPGAFMTYDTNSKILFSADIFGAFSDKWDLYAGDDYISHMKKFMEPYTPSYEIFKPVLDALESMDIEMIAPQHGSIITGANVKKILAAARTFEYGSYLREYYGK